MAPILKILPVGGLGEIGKNMMLFEFNNEAFIIDTGIMFPEHDMPGIDYIIPDMSYIKDNLERLTIHGIFVTHGHEDHTGAINHVLDVVRAPIYATPLTAGLLEVKLKQEKRHGLNLLNIFNAGDIIKAGPFKLESFHVAHSIPDCVGFGIHTPVGLIVHTGDFKFDHTPVDGWPPDFARIASFAREGVLALLADSTNADRPGWTPSEKVIDAAFDRVFQQARGRIMVATFASLISRIDQVATACRKYRRKMAIAGHSMQANIAMARKLGYLNFPENLIISLEKAASLPDHKIVYMVTGSQGEPSAVLSRLAHKRHGQLDVRPGDTVIMSSHPIPGNEEMTKTVINRLFQQGATVIYDPIEDVHVSGHASQEEMKLMINLVRPKFFVPVHGELRHLHAHARLAVDMGIPAENCVVVENGTFLEFTPKSMTVGERYPGGYVFVDGAGVGDVGPAVIRDREILSNEGFVIIIIVLNKKGKLLEEPHIISRGFVFLREANELFDTVRERIRQIITSHPGRKLDEVIQDSVARLLNQETRRRPMIFVHIHEAAS